MLFLMRTCWFSVRSLACEGTRHLRLETVSSCFVFSMDVYIPDLLVYVKIVHIKSKWGTQKLYAKLLHVLRKCVH